MNLLEKSSVIVGMTALCVLSGCASYLNHNDSVTFGAGNAVEANLGISTIKPFPPRVGDTDIEISQKKTQDAIDRYNAPSDPAVVGSTAAPNVTIAN